MPHRTLLPLFILTLLTAIPLHADEGKDESGQGFSAQNQIEAQTQARKRAFEQQRELAKEQREWQREQAKEQRQQQEELAREQERELQHTQERWFEREREATSGAAVQGGFSFEANPALTL